MGNIAILFTALVVCFLLSGSYHESCVTPQIQVGEDAVSGTLTIFVADEDTDVFKAVSNNTGTTVYVAHGNTVDIPITFTLDFDDEPALAGILYMNINGTLYPCSAAEGNVFTASTTQSYTASEDAAELGVEVTCYYVEETNQILSFTLPVKSAPLVVCPGCGSVIAADGTMSHTTCPGCGEACVDGVVEHVICSGCGETCVDGVFEHGVCPGCGEACVDGVVEHGVCPGCGEACVDGVVEHGVCPGCGEACVDGVFAHATCPGCGETCVDGVFEHGVCPGCGEACVDGVVEHATCSGCGEECVDGVFEHGVCSGCGEECVDGTIAHAACETCGEVCTGNGIVHKEDCSHTGQAPDEPDTPAVPGDPEPPEAPEASPEPPRTGDSTPLTVHLVVMLVSFGAVLAIVIRLKREKA